MAASFDIQRYLKEGWDFFVQNAANLVVATIIFIVIHIVANLIPLASLLVSGPMIGGMYYVILDARRGEKFDVMRIFDGFKLKLVPLVLVGILTTVFTMAGLILLILPAFLVMGWYLFSFLFVVDQEKDFWPAMESSREIGFQNHVNVFLMAFVVVTLNFAGLLALGIGVLVTMPLSLCAIVMAYEDQTGRAPAKAAPESASGAVTQTPPPPPPGE